MPRLTLHARYVFPVAGPPIADGWVTIDGPRIVAVGSGRGEGEVLDLGNAAILPGLVNAHAHLDFSGLDAPLGEPGIGFVDWIRRVMEYRRTEDRSADPILRGLAESMRYGVTAIGDVAQPILAKPQAVDMALTIFQELIAPTRERIVAALTLANNHLSYFSSPSHSSHISLGLSPHAPFSVHPELLSAIVALSASKKIPLAMHLAESREEMDLLRYGTGPLRMFLEEIGAWDATAIQPGIRVLGYLKSLASAHRALIIHGNYLDDEEIAFLGSKHERMAAVYCPRTHDWFARGEYPLQKMLAAGVVVALGTDGRGSSPDLSLLAEMRHAARRHPGVGLDRILRMGTLDGAKALGQERDVGSLERGKQADLAIVALPDREVADPYALLFDSEEPVIGRYCCGEETCLNPDFPKRLSSSSSTSVSETPQ
jgi:cytosine/adenosine deaminase-related metal-dependent hydrolase